MNKRTNSYLSSIHKGISDPLGNMGRYFRPPPLRMKQKSKERFVISGLIGD